MLNKGPTSTILTGPSVDHTTMSPQGYYIYMNALSASPNATARLFSPKLNQKPNKSGCLQFFYHMFGPDVSQLNLYVTNVTNLASYGKPLWQKKGNKGDKWLLGQFYAENILEDREIKFLIEGVVRRYFKIHFKNKIKIK